MAVGKEGEDDRTHCSANVEGIILRRKLEMWEKQDFPLLVVGGMTDSLLHRVREKIMRAIGDGLNVMRKGGNWGLIPVPLVSLWSRVGASIVAVVSSELSGWILARVHWCLILHLVSRGAVELAPASAPSSPASSVLIILGIIVNRGGGGCRSVSISATHHLHPISWGEGLGIACELRGSGVRGLGEMGGKLGGSAVALIGHHLHWRRARISWRPSISARACGAAGPSALLGRGRAAGAGGFGPVVHRHVTECRGVDLRRFGLDFFQTRGGKSTSGATIAVAPAG